MYELTAPLRQTRMMIGLTDESPLKWKNVEAKKKATVHRIDKCEHYNGEKFPVVRFRSSIKGPCLGLKMVEYIMNIDERAQWDPQIDALTDMYIANNLDDVNAVLPDEYGNCAMFGIGYTRTKRYLVVDGREQLTLCGLQEFANGGALIWGVEIEERHDALFPQDQKRHTRAKTCLYSTALVPTGEGTFDAEYILQLDPGGNLPSFLTTPIMIDSVKTMFSQAKRDFGDGDMMKEWMDAHPRNSDNNDDRNEEMMKERLGLLLTP